MTCGDLVAALPHQLLRGAEGGLAVPSEPASPFAVFSAPSSTDAAGDGSHAATLVGGAGVLGALQDGVRRVVAREGNPAPGTVLTDASFFPIAATPTDLGFAAVEGYTAALAGGAHTAGIGFRTPPGGLSARAGARVRG